MGKQRARRQFSADFKRRVVAESYAPGTSVSVVARRHDINANLLFRWRDDPRYAFQNQSFLPVEISPAGIDPKPAGEQPLPSELGIWIAGDVRLVVKGGFEPETLGQLIRSIRTAL